VRQVFEVNPQASSSSTMELDIPIPVDIPPLTPSVSDPEVHGDPSDLASFANNPDSEEEGDLLGEEEPMDTNVQVSPEQEQRLLDSPEVLEVDPSGVLNVTLEEVDISPAAQTSSAEAAPPPTPVIQDSPATQDSPVIQDVPMSQDTPATQENVTPQVTPASQESGQALEEREEGEWSDDGSTPEATIQSDGTLDGGWQQAPRRTRQRGGQSTQQAASSGRGTTQGKRGPRNRGGRTPSGSQLPIPVTSTTGDNKRLRSPSAVATQTRKKSAASSHSVQDPKGKYDPSVKTGFSLVWDSPQCPCSQANTTPMAERLTHMRYHHQPYRLRYACPHCLTSLPADLGIQAKGHIMLHPSMCGPSKLIRLHVWNLIPLEWVGSMTYGGSLS
jgi:hypothetical protein